MIKLGVQLKKYRALISAICLVVIVAICGVSLTACKPYKPHKVAIYKLYGSEFLEEDYQNYGDVIKDGKIVGDISPVLTEKDIVGYNAETQMIFLSDEIIGKYQKDLDALEPSELFYGERLLDGGSLILGGGFWKDNSSAVFVIAVDDEVVLGGSLEVSVLSSFIPSGFMIGDCPEGLCVGISSPAEGVTADDYKVHLDQLAEDFEEMNLLTDKVSFASHSAFYQDFSTFYENNNTGEEN